MVCLSCRISPLTSTVIFFDRSPLAMAVATSAMLRTCAVRLLAIEFTLSVKSFQVPATPGTLAWPPRRPSVPTSRATRVTSEAKAFNWSTMVLMVFLSSRISPRTSTVIFFDRSPLATAVVTSAMLRTWAVRLAAMELTLSVRSFQTPAAPLTRAWPPSLPWVPTSSATRVTSDVSERSCCTIALTVRAVRSNWPSRGRPSGSRFIVSYRSPAATELITRATLERFLALRSLLSMMPLISAASRAIGPPLATGTRTAKFPRFTSRSTERSRSASAPLIPSAERPATRFGLSPLGLPDVTASFRPDAWGWRLSRWAFATSYRYTRSSCRSHQMWNDYTPSLRHFTKLNGISQGADGAVRRSALTRWGGRLVPGRELRPIARLEHGSLGLAEVLNQGCIVKARGAHEFPGIERRQRRPDDLLRLHGHALQPAPVHPESVVEFGGDNAGKQRLQPDAAIPQFTGRKLRERQDVRLCPRIDGSVRHRVGGDRAGQGEERGHVDDRAAVAFHHPRQNGPRQHGDRTHVKGKQVIGDAGIQLDKRSIARDAGAVDQNLDLVIRRPSAKLGDSGRHRKISGQDLRVCSVPCPK